MGRTPETEVRPVDDPSFQAGVEKFRKARENQPGVSSILVANQLISSLNATEGDSPATYKKAAGIVYAASQGKRPALARTA